MNIPNYNELNASNGRACSIELHYPEFYNFLIKTFPPELTFPERIYWFYNNIEHKPVCKICGAPVKFINFRDGYREYCSKKCMQSDPITLEKKQKTCLERFGTTNAMHCPEKLEKLKKTNLEKFGVENPFSNKSIQQKIRDTNLKKYGVEYHVQTDGYKTLMRNRNYLKFIKSHPDFIPLDNQQNVVMCKAQYRVPCPHPECNKCKEKAFVTDAGHYYDRERWNIEQCTNLLPIQTSHNKGTTIELFITEILDKYNIEYKTNVRDIIKPKEIDIYLPDYKLGIECNGDYIHQKWYGQYHHYDKYELAKKNGIKLIQIYDDQIELRPDVVRSMLLSKLGIFETRIGARECVVGEVSPKVCDEFFNRNHIQGPAASKIRLGLYHKNKLVSVMTFAKKRRAVIGDKTQEQGVYELIRFASIINTQVIGAAGKLLQYFIKHYNPSKIISYSSNDISWGELYIKLGFKQTSINKSSYWYVNNTIPHIRHHRSNFSISALKQKGLYVPGKTESEIMEKLPYWKIYDSGTTRWEKQI